MQYEIKNRFTGAVQFTAEIEADANTFWRVKIGLAVKWALKSGAVLSDAVLSDADLRDADLSDAVLSDAVLSGAVLSDAVLSGADLRGADLRGAVLSGAVLSGYKIKSIITRVTRCDGYEFIGFVTNKGILVRAGCRTLLLTQYRAHIISEYPDTSKAQETTAILDFIEARAKVLEVIP